jgi:hypothetical protein
VEFDDGVWEIEVHKNGTEIKLHVDPRAGQTKAR